MPSQPSALLTTEFRDVVERQDGVLSRRQLRELGVTRQHIRNRVLAGTWQELGSLVLVLHGGELSERQRLWVAVQHGGEGAALCGLTAATADGLEGFRSNVLHVVVPHGRNRPDLAHPGIHVKVHESRHLEPNDIHPIRTPPRTVLPRSIVEGASLSQSDGKRRAIIAAAVQQRLVRPPALREFTAARPTLPNRALILKTIGDVEGGSHSLPELDYLRGLRRAGLPMPARQRRVRRPGGLYYLDAEFDPYQVTVEINGAQHLRLPSKEADDTRRNRLAIGGRLVVDLGSHTVRHDIDLAILMTADALLARGWEPTPAVRRRLDQRAANRSFTWSGGPTND